MSQNFYAIVVGVALHHMPAAFALATLLRLRLGSFRRVWPWLLIFALASPVGIVFSNYVVLSQLLSSGLYAALLGLVAGNFPARVHHHSLRNQPRASPQLAQAGRYAGGPAAGAGRGLSKAVSWVRV